MLAIRQHRSTPQSIELRIDIVLGASDGVANHTLARNLATSLPTVLLWRRRYESEGIVGILEDHPRGGRPKSITAEREAAIVEATLRTQPVDAIHWSVRTMASAQDVSPATVHRIWRRHHLQPHRVESFKFSTDPEFVAKVRPLAFAQVQSPHLPASSGPGFLEPAMFNSRSVHLAIHRRPYSRAAARDRVSGSPLQPGGRHRSRQDSPCPGLRRRQEIRPTPDSSCFLLEKGVPKADAHSEAGVPFFR